MSQGICHGVLVTRNLLWGICYELVATVCLSRGIFHQVFVMVCFCEVLLGVCHGMFHELFVKNMLDNSLLTLLIEII